MSARRQAAEYRRQAAARRAGAEGPKRSTSTTGGTAAVGDYWKNRDTSGGTSGSTGTKTTTGSSYTRPTGVAWPKAQPGQGFAGLSGYAYGQRQGTNPDAFERFPYGVEFRTQDASTAAFTDLDPGYQSFLNTLARHPNIGTKQSTGRMLWERFNTLSAERTKRGDFVSPQQLAAELASSLGVDPLEGRDGSDPFGGSGSRSYGGGGYGGGGGSSSVSLTDPTSARGLLMQVMRSMLGRRPDEEEYKTFLEALNEAERANPRTVEMEGSTAVQAGGLDPSMIAMEYVEGLEEFDSAEGQRTFDAFMQVLGS